MQNSSITDPDKLLKREEAAYSELTENAIIQPKLITDQQFTKMEEEIYTYWPTAKHLPKNSNTLSVSDYEESLIRSNPVEKTQFRRDEFRTYFRNKVEALLGIEVANSVYRQLATNHSIATAQHYTTLSPKTLNPTLQTSLAYFNRTEPERENLIVLGCSGISFNNHWYPRGYLFHALIDERIVEHPFAFFGRAYDADPVISAPPFDMEVKKAMTKLLVHYRSEKQIKKREFNKIGQFMEEILFTPEILSQHHYVDQVSITNFHLWKQIFSSYQGHVPNLIFISQEQLAAELICAYHITSNTILNKFIFNKTWHDLIYKYFNNIMCAFSVERKYGTFLFWGVSKNGKSRVQLFMKNGALSSEDGEYVFAMTPETISMALQNGQLTPSTMLTFIVLSLYYGFFLTGGLDQPTYLTQTKQAYLKLLTDLSMHEEIENCEPIVTDDIVFTRPSLAFLQGPNEQRVPASALDMLLYDAQKAWPMIMEIAKTLPLKKLIYRLYPELYRDYCNHPGKDNELLSINERDIENYTGIDKKIPPIATL